MFPVAIAQDAEDHMRRTALPRSPAIRLLFGAALGAAATLSAAHAADDAAATCKKAWGEVAVAACTRAIASGQYDGHELAKLHFYRAIGHDQKGDSALADYSEAIRLKPEDAEFYNNRGGAWPGKGDYDRAIADFSEAIRLNPHTDYSEATRPHPKGAEVYYTRGLAWLGKGDFDRAIADFSEAIRFNPKHAAVYFIRGTAYAATGSFRRALQDYYKAYRLGREER
jgi:tetratricopeptide (TPR) repeat protein